jgi:hypothetical protein
MYLENRLIAMIDVLGFSSRIETRKGMELTSEKYAELIAQAKEYMFAPKPVLGSPQAPEPNFEYGQFVFDTLVLVSYPTDSKSIYRFIFAIILLMERFFAEGFPLRGSIAKGDFCKNEASDIFLSNTFKRLHLDEDNQQWTGCILMPEAEEFVVSSLLGSVVPNTLPRSSPLHHIATPRKRMTGEPTKRWCLNWSHFLSPSTIQLGLQQMGGDLEKQKKTTEYLELLGQIPDDAQVLPPEFAPAKRMKVMKARSGMRVKFEDDDGNGVNPRCEYTIAAHESVAQPCASENPPPSAHH